MAEEFENLELKDENTGEVETFTPVDVTAREQIESLNETLTEQNIFGLGTALAEGTDLNDIGYGKFYISSSSTAATLINAPATDVAFMVLSLPTTSLASNRSFQFAVLNKSSSFLYARTLSPNGWSDWTALV